jgi:anti-anti-sigma regulatory factor
VCDLSASPHVDLAGAEMLKGLEAELRGLGIRLRIVEARSRVRDRLRREGLAEVTERIDRRATVADAVEELQASRGEAQPPKETASPA